ncbi:hypothetical protein F5Y11DRAFT_300740 [Daldinia sp. FL1419]|nr:hypothetical protein F5Y11DRAFT_300740 [Daldinia sp. FL1419]
MGVTTGTGARVALRRGVFLLALLQSLSLSLSLFAQGGEAKSTITPAPSSPRPTTVPIFVPDIPGTYWSAWRGSIVSSNAIETVYTIFCEPFRFGCHVDPDDVSPFQFTEGPGTFHAAATVAGSFSFTQTCILTSTTAATCSGSTWVAGAFTESFGEPVTNTSVAPYTITGAAVEVSWGVLTLGDPPLTEIEAGRTYTYYFTSPLTRTTTTTATVTAGAGAQTQGSDGGSGGAKGKPKKSGAGLRAGVWKGGMIVVGLVAILVWYGDGVMG